MRHRFAAAVGVTSLVVSSMIGVAATAAADDGPVSSDGIWTMPGPFKGGTLAQAEAALQPLVDAGVVKINAYNKLGPTQEILNPTNWIVCGQSPRAGNMYQIKMKNGQMPKPKTVSLPLRRPDASCRG